jgi:hypothetical protein
MKQAIYSKNNKPITMPKVIFVKKAQKDIPGTNIKKGDSYYWWKFRFGGKRTSKTYPKRSQLTQSDFLQRIYEIEDQLSGASFSEPKDVETFIDEINSELSIDDIDVDDTDLDPEEATEDEVEEAKQKVLEEKQETEHENWCNERAEEVNNISYNGS